jgi:hypothetical protein
MECGNGAFKYMPLVFAELARMSSFSLEPASDPELLDGHGYRLRLMRFASALLVKIEHSRVYVESALMLRLESKFELFNV